MVREEDKSNDSIILVMLYRVDNVIVPGLTREIFETYPGFIRYSNLYWSFVANSDRLAG